MVVAMTMILLRLFIGISVYFSICTCIEAFIPERATSILSLRHSRNNPGRLWGTIDGNNSLDGDDDDEEEELKPTAYGNHSLAWTNRYRRLITYEYARAQAMSLGLSSKEEWEALGHQGPYMISRPDEMYQEEWVSWEEFLGVMRPYEETKQIVQYVLKLKSMDEYRQFVKSDPKRAEGLRIPAKPDIVYRDSGWQGSQVFFGTSSTSTQ